MAVDGAMTQTATDVPSTAEPPIALLLPLLQSALTGLSLLLRLAARLLLATVSPLGIVWSIIHALLSPVLILLDIALDIALFTPFAIIRKVAVTLYPVYVFFAVACIFGAAVGIFGQYVSAAILNVLARSTYFSRSPSASAAPPSNPQVTLRKRKRKSVRLQ